MTERGSFERVFDDSNRVWVLVRPSGKSDAEDYINGLDKVHKARFHRYMQRFCDGHQNKVPEHVRVLQGGGSSPVLEMKSGIHRLYVVDHAGIWYLTHGRTKPKNNRVNSEIAKALAFYRECIERAGGDSRGNL